MINKIRYWGIILLLICCSTLSYSMEIKKEVIASIPDELVFAKLIGLRVYKNQAFIMASNGSFLTIDLLKGNMTSHKIKSAKIVDFDLSDGKMIYLNDQGMVCGSSLSKSSKGPYDSCRIDVCDQGIFLSGGDNAFFLPNKATSSFELPGFFMALPFENGFVWRMGLNKEKNWELNIYDCFGNLMGKGFRFRKSFNPSNLEIGPRGIDGELLVSSKEGEKRTLALIGTNGRMFWKIDRPDKVCLRDVAFGNMGELLFLEKRPKNDFISVKYFFFAES